MIERNSDEGSSRRLSVFFDGACPLCQREISFYRKRRGASEIEWVDVSALERDPAPGLSACDAMARFHIRDRDGRLYSGAHAFARLWRALPEFHFVGRCAENPLVLWVLERAYRLFLRIRPGLQKFAAHRTDAASGVR